MTERRSTDDITDDHFGLRPGVLWPQDQEAEHEGVKKIQQDWAERKSWWDFLDAFFGS